MAGRILVPLDGSRLAEAALPAAAYLAERLDAEVFLIHLLERHPPKRVHGDRHLDDPAEAGAYLQEIARSRFSPGTVVQTHVHPGETRSVARGIAQHREEMAADLLVMCRHGGPKATRLLLGSIGERVSSLSATPVLLLHPKPEAQQPAFRCASILLPVDEALRHTAAAEQAGRLAAACRAEVRLLMVVPTYGTLSGRGSATGRLLPGATAGALDMSAELAAQQLQRFAEPLRAQGLSVSTQVARGEPARVITRLARRGPVDLLVLGTHGATGVQAVWEGSVAGRVCARCRVPLLLVPV
jgi:nucleotide-binding universal stress UspA family protein